MVAGTLCRLLLSCLLIVAPSFTLACEGHLGRTCSLVPLASILCAVFLHMASCDDDVQVWKQRISLLYHKFNPDRLDRLDQILHKYAGHLKTLYDALVDKYIMKKIWYNDLKCLAVDVGRVPARSARFDLARAAHPPRDPAGFAKVQSRDTWQPCSEAGVKQVAFLSTMLSGSWESQVWEWLGALAPAGILEENYYAGTDVETNAFLKGDALTPAVRCTKLQVTINWFLSRDGRIRIDGSVDAVRDALEALRKTHCPYIKGASAHGVLTGKHGATKRNGGLLERGGNKRHR